MRWIGACLPCAGGHSYTEAPGGRQDQLFAVGASRAASLPNAAGVGEISEPLPILLRHGANRRELVVGLPLKGDVRSRPAVWLGGAGFKQMVHPAQQSTALSKLPFIRSVSQLFRSGRE